MTQQPQAKYRHDYRAPDYTTTDIDLDFSLDAETTRVSAVSKIKRQGAAGAPLVLDGEDLTLVSIQVDGQPWSAYRQQDNQLIVEELPAQFTLTIVNDIHPAKNTALEGLYLSGDALCTQCEAEGFHHITYYQDRPDVLARFTTRIVADKARYPFLLSNGNRIGQVNWPMVATGCNGRIRSRNLATCSRWWRGLRRAARQLHHPFRP